jgi:2-oxoisovalerate dehydrogenase E1 component alpha subunit
VAKAAARAARQGPAARRREREASAQMGDARTLSLDIPQPAARPGDAPNFDPANFPPAGIVPRPDVATPAAEMRELPYQLIRVLDDQGQAVGAWDPHLDPEILRRGLKAMMTTRVFDDRMFRAQRQGKTSFFMKTTGEEAIAVAQALVLNRDDMCFTTYRQAGILITRGYPIRDMMNQIYSNAADPLKGLQLPILYSAPDYGFFTLSGNIATQFPQAVGWAMASAYSGDTKIASGFIGDGSTAEGDFHYALTFAAVYRAPVILNVVNNQWAISSFHGIAGGTRTTFAARGLAYGLPALRVDGNDFLAVYAATQWAAERARANLGATVIEFYTYRAEGHSTSDDPGRYRPVDEAKHWPLGDPLERLKQHLIGLGEWSEDQHEAFQAQTEAEVRAIQREAEAVGTLGKGRKPPASAIFDHVFKEPDWRLVRQREEMGG